MEQIERQPDSIQTIEDLKNILLSRILGASLIAFACTFLPPPFYLFGPVAAGLFILFSRKDISAMRERTSLIGTFLMAREDHDELTDIYHEALGRMRDASGRDLKELYLAISTEFRDAGWHTLEQQIALDAAYETVKWPGDIDKRAKMLAATRKK